jgi:hypothetical protein
LFDERCHMDWKLTRSFCYIGLVVDVNHSLTAFVHEWKTCQACYQVNWPRRLICLDRTRNVRDRLSSSIDLPVVSMCSIMSGSVHLSVTTCLFSSRVYPMHLWVRWIPLACQISASSMPCSTHFGFIVRWLNATSNTQEFARKSSSILSALSQRRSHWWDRVEY